MSVIQTFDYFVFDVDQTLAKNGQPIPKVLVEKLIRLIEHINIVLVTSRGIAEGFEEFASYFACSSGKQLAVFPNSAAQGFQVDLATGKIFQLYDKAEEDNAYKKFHDRFKEDLKIYHIEQDTDVQYDENEIERKVQIHDRGGQVTFYFSHKKLREEYENALVEYDVAFIRHGRNVLHVLPAGIDKKYAINYLSRNGDGRYLVFADGFHDDPKTGRKGNDLSFTELSNNYVTCINVGRYPPKAGLGVWYHPTSSLVEWELTDTLLNKISLGCSFDELELLNVSVAT